MRISLGEARPKPQARPKRRSRRRPSRTFDVATIQPMVRPGPRWQRAGAAQRRARAQAAPHAEQTETRSLVITPPAFLARFLRANWWALLLLLALLGTLGYAYADTRFFVYRANIAGAHYLGAKAIYQASGVDKQSIFWIDPKQVAGRIIALNGVQAVRVHCGLPAIVTIEVEERQPVVLWRSRSQKHDWWLDAEGVVLPYNGDPDADSTVFVVDSSDLKLKPGDRVQPKELVQAVLQMAAALPGVRVFNYQADRGLSFTQQASGGQWPVYVGTGEDLQHKIQVVEVLTKYLVSKSIRPSYVDVRWADRPLYGMPNGKSGAGGN